jgi:hypothetical protein
MTCKSCAERRKRLQAKLAEKKAKRQGLQAAAIGAALVGFEAAGKVLGIGEDTEDGKRDGQKDSGSGEGIE